jgi:hypothetical protein
MNVATTGGSTTLVTVNLSTTTALDEPGVSSPSLSDIVTGDQVQVSGTRDASGVVDATSVTVPLVGQSGTVISAPGSAAPTSFTIDVAGATGTTLVTVNVGTTTTFTEPGVSSTSLADILTGDQVQVMGAPDGTGVVDATSVTVPLARISGTVVSVPGSTAPTNFTISVSGTGGTTMVTVDVVTTALNEPGVSAPALGNILAGDQVQVTGAQDGTGMVNATSVTISPTTVPPTPARTGHSGFGGHGSHRHHG